MGSLDLVASWLGPWLHGPGPSRRVLGVPASVVAAADSLGDGRSASGLDGLPPVQVMARAALELSPHAVLHGWLFDGSRLDARLLFDVIELPAAVPEELLRSRIGEVFTDGERPDVVELLRARDRWQLRRD